MDNHSEHLDINNDDDITDDFNINETVENEINEEVDKDNIITFDEGWTSTDYPDLLERAFSLLRATTSSSTNNRYKMVPLNVQREGPKKTIFVNCITVCERMHRDPEHLVLYFMTELSTTASFDGNGYLIIKGKYRQNQIENLLKKYLLEYVLCKSCKSASTTLKKDNRLWFVECASCNSLQSVPPIISGYKAQIGRRKH